MNAPGFIGSPLDRADPIRSDPAAVAAARADPRARLLKLTGLEPELDAQDQLVWQKLGDIDPAIELVLLGLVDGVPHFAAIPGERPSPARSPALNDMLARMPASEAASYAAARSLVDWHARHRFCSACGTATELHRAGWARHCPNCGTEHFPRTDPVVIMLAECGDRALVGRQPAFPPGRYSALAGFLEPGEAIEEAVAREIREEAGVPVGRVRYLFSQPWPFPSSLMIACIAEALDDRITRDTHELEDAMWVTRDEVRAALAGAPGARFQVPPRYAIAHTLLEAWAAGS